MASGVGRAPPRRHLAVVAALAALALAGRASGSGGVAILEPAAGSSVGGLVTIRASAPAGTASVQFSWSADGTSWSPIATDATASDGWAASWESVVFNGAAHLKATASRGGSATVAVTVDNVPPTLRVTVSPTAFSPNGDGRKDAARLTLSSSEDALLEIRVECPRNPVGTLAHSGLPGHELHLRWNGRDGAGRRVADGRYRALATARDAAGNASSTDVQVRVDTLGPRLRWASRGGIVGARPLTVRFLLRDVSPPLAGLLQFESAYGRIVHSWRGPVVERGSTRLSRRAILAAVPGVYRLRAVVTDAAGNRSESRSPPYRLDHAVRTHVVKHVDNVGSRVALTFDDCSSAASWSSILRTLARYRIAAGFFCPGAVVGAQPRLAARTARDGHTLGSHNWDHAWLPGLPYSGVLWRLRYDRALWWRWGAAPTPYFRPAYGAVRSETLAAAGAAGYRYTVLWDVDPQDWRGLGVGAIVAHTVGSARPGSIILLHLTPQTAAALPSIIRGLRTRGLQPVGLDRLLHIPGARLREGTATIVRRSSRSMR